MHDKNGKTLNVGDDIYHMAYGMMIITSVGKSAATGEDYLFAVDREDEDKRYGYPQPALLEDNIIKVRSWKELAQLSFDVQNACNLSGIVASFAQVIPEVRYRLESEGKGGTAAVNTHPICVLFADKIAHLTGTQTLGGLAEMQAYRWAHNTIEEK